MVCLYEFYCLGQNRIVSGGVVSYELGLCCAVSFLGGSKFDE